MGYVKHDVSKAIKTVMNSASGGFREQAADLKRVSVVPSDQLVELALCQPCVNTDSLRRGFGSVRGSCAERAGCTVLARRVFSRTNTRNDRCEINSQEKEILTADVEKMTKRIHSAEGELEQSEQEIAQVICVHNRAKGSTMSK